MNLLAASLAVLVAAQAAGSAPPASPPAAADDAPGTLGFDIHCMLMLTATIESAPPEARASRIAAMLYYSGRVDVGARGIDLEERMMAEMHYFDHADPAAVVQACGAFLTERGVERMALGARITAQEEMARTR